MTLKTLIGILLTFALLASSLPAAAAQDAAYSHVPGLGEPAVLLGEDDSPIASVRVTDVDNEYQVPDDGWYPKYGYTYRAVSFEVENLSDASMIAEPGHFRVIDEHGFAHGRTFFGSSDESPDQFVDGVALAAGEIYATQLFFAVPAHLELGMFVWQPGSPSLAMIDLSSESSETGAIAHGFHSPAVMTDEFGNVVATIQVNDVVSGWQDHTAFGDPAAGMTYWAVHVTVTNETNRPVQVAGFDFKLVDTGNRSSRYAMVNSHEDAEIEVFRNDDVEPGETLEAMIVFELPEGAEPILLYWEDYSVSSPINILAERRDAGADDMATPEGEATPMAN